MFDKVFACVYVQYLKYIYAFISDFCNVCVIIQHIYTNVWIFLSECLLLFFLFTHLSI